MQWDIKTNRRENWNGKKQTETKCKNNEPSMNENRETMKLEFWQKLCFHTSLTPNDKSKGAVKPRLISKFQGDPKRYGMMNWQFAENYVIARASHPMINQRARWSLVSNKISLRFEPLWNDVILSWRGGISEQSKNTKKSKTNKRKIKRPQMFSREPHTQW